MSSQNRTHIAADLLKTPSIFKTAVSQGLPAKRLSKQTHILAYNPKTTTLKMANGPIEPTKGHVYFSGVDVSAVDKITRRSLQTEIERIYQQGQLAIMFVTHDIDEAMRLGTKLLIINDGILQRFDPPDEIMAHPATDYVEQLISEYR